MGGSFNLAILHGKPHWHRVAPITLFIVELLSQVALSAPCGKTLMVHIVLCSSHKGDVTLAPLSFFLVIIIIPHDGCHERGRNTGGQGPRTKDEEVGRV